MSKLLTGKIISPNKLQVGTIYNLDAPENQDLDLSKGVIVEAELEFPQPQLGKSFIWYVNPETKEQWFEEYDRPLTPEEEIKQQLLSQQFIIDQLVLDALGGGKSV